MDYKEIINTASTVSQAMDTVEADIYTPLGQTRNSVLGYFYKGSKKVARFLYVKCLSAI